LVNCEQTNQLREMAEGICKTINPVFSIHDFRITNGENRINLIFDLVVPHTFDEQEKKKTINEIARLIQQKDERYRTVIQIDTLYI